jgi:hypothetical protein
LGNKNALWDGANHYVAGDNHYVAGHIIELPRGIMALPRRNHYVAGNESTRCLDESSGCRFLIIELPETGVGF